MSDHYKCFRCGSFINTGGHICPYCHAEQFPSDEDVKSGCIAVLVIAAIIALFFFCSWVMKGV